jgi:hypothetical protein
VLYGQGTSPDPRLVDVLPGGAAWCRLVVPVVPASCFINLLKRDLRR